MKKPRHHQCQGQSPHTKQKGTCAMTAQELHTPTVVEDEQRVIGQALQTVINTEATGIGTPAGK